MKYTYTSGMRRKSKRQKNSDGSRADPYWWGKTFFFQLYYHKERGAAGDCFGDRFFAEESFLIQVP